MSIKRKRQSNGSVGPRKKVKLPPIEAAKLVRMTQKDNLNFRDAANMPNEIIVNANGFLFGRKPFTNPGFGDPKPGSPVGQTLRNIADISFRECHISSLHAEMVWTRNGKWMMKSKGTNGMLINGENLPKGSTATLSLNDELVFGNREQWPTKKFGVVKNLAKYRFTWFDDAKNKREAGVSAFDERLAKAKKAELEKKEMAAKAVLEEAMLKKKEMETKAKEQERALEEARLLKEKAKKEELEMKMKVRKQKEEMERNAQKQKEEMERKAQKQKEEMERKAQKQKEEIEKAKKELEETARKKQRELELREKERLEALEKIEAKKKGELEKIEKEQNAALQKARLLEEQAKAHQDELERERNKVQQQKARMKEEKNVLERKKSELEQKEQTFDQQNKEREEAEKKRRSEQKKLNDLHECPLCCEFMFLPISTKCGHTFCKKCIWEIMLASKKPDCPVCRQRLKLNKSVLFGLKTTIEDVILPAASELEREEYEEKKEEHLEWLRKHKVP